jgi:hypothetical protein
MEGLHTRSQTALPMPTVHANEALRSRMATFLARPSMPARVDRTVCMASGSSVTIRTQLVTSYFNF